MYMDKSNRPCVSMKLYNHLDTAAGYKKGDSVNGYIYEINEKMGAFVAVEDKYQGLIPKQELHKQNLLEDYQTSCREFINNELISGEKERQFGPIVSQMLDYIHEHYAEKITLGIIAKNLHYIQPYQS